MILGIIAAFLATLFQSTSYIFSRSYLVKHSSGGVFGLLIISQCIIGLISMCIMPFCIPDSMAVVSDILPYIIVAFVSYFWGQFCFFKTLKHSEASKISSLLGLKIICIALISSLLGVRFGLLQWCAIALAGSAVLIFAFTGGRDDGSFKNKLYVLLWVFLICLGYASCDIASAGAIRMLLGEMSILRATFFVVSSQYLIVGVSSVLFLPGVIRRNGKGVADAVAYSVTWFVGILALFSSFAFVSVVLSNIIQSTRGLTSILIAMIVAKCGHTHLEAKMSAKVMLKRAVVALCMCVAVILYVLGSAA